MRRKLKLSKAERERIVRFIKQIETDGAQIENKIREEILNV